MTIETPICSVTAQGNGATTSFSYNFLIPFQSDGATPASAVYITLADGTLQTLAYPVDYLIAGVGDSGGGTVAYPLSGSPLPLGAYITIERDLNYTQDTSVPNAKFYPHTVEEIADKLDMQIQQVHLGTSRAISLPPGPGGGSAVLPSAVDRENTVLAFDAQGNLGLIPTMPVTPGTMRTDGSNGTAGALNTLLGISGNKITGPLGIGTQNYAPLTVGTYTGAGFLSDGGIVLARILSDATGNTFAHGFAEVSAMTRSGLSAFAAFTANTSYLDFGVTPRSYDHFVAYQDDFILDATGTGANAGSTITNVWTLLSQPTFTAGVAFNRFGTYIGNPTGSVGCIVKNYAHYVEAQTKGSGLNYAYYAEPGGNIYQGPKVQIGGVGVPANNTHQLDVFGAAAGGANNLSAACFTGGTAVGTAGLTAGQILIGSDPTTQLSIAWSPADGSGHIDAPNGGKVIYRTGTNVEMTYGLGMTLGAPTGGLKGLGSLNIAGDIYKNNTAYTNPDYVFERYYTGEIVRFADNEGAVNYHGLPSLDDLRAYTSAKLRLPGITDEPMGSFGRQDFLLEKLEEAFLYIMALHERVKELESK